MACPRERITSYSIRGAFLSKLSVKSDRGQRRVIIPRPLARGCAAGRAAGSPPHDSATDRRAVVPRPHPADAAAKRRVTPRRV
ncbi:protein of unknown function [Burkholderia multivorans]